MNSWINLHALWQILVLGLVCGAGLPAIFAVGLRVLSPASGPQPVTAAGGPITTNPLRVGTAALCFLIVLASIGWGIYLIVDGS